VLHLLGPILALAALLSQPPAAPSRVQLAYRSPVGQVATYLVVFEVNGEQVSLNERRPVSIRAEAELREQVIACEEDGSFWLRVSGKLLKAQDAGGTFGAGQHADWPDVEVHMSMLGETMEARPVVSRQRAGTAPPYSAERHAGPFQQAFADVLGQPVAVVLPVGAIGVGEAWCWERNGAWQSNRLLGMSGKPCQVAHIASSGREPIALEGRSEALGVTTKVTGEQRQTSEVRLLLPQGVTATATGQMRVQTRSETVLEVPASAGMTQEQQRFPMRSDLKIIFRIRLLALDGEPLDLAACAPGIRAGCSSRPD